MTFNDMTVVNDVISPSQSVLPKTVIVEGASLEGTQTDGKC